MTRQPSPSRSPSSWVGFKELARQQYERGDYEAALTSYTSALNPEFNCPSSEQQIILSNLVACRLKIGGPAQARAAVENAKTCIEKNPQWAKGHVRLASAYIALGGHSNDACNELQRALAIDPGNTTAREMLVRELRRDHAYASRASNTASSNSETNSTTQQDYARPDFDEAAYPQQHSIDGSLTWSEWFQFHLGRATAWYESQSDDAKTGLKILLVVLVLYVAFGGRFGFEGTRQTGNYGSDNVYEQYRKYGTTESQSRSSYPYQDSSSRGRGRDNNHRRTKYSSQGNDDYYYGSTNYGGGGYGGGYGGGGYRGGGLLDGSLQSMLILGGTVFAGQRMGINPFQTMMFMNMMGGGRAGLRPRRGFGMGMGGFGFGGGMGGMGRMRHRGRRF